MKRKRHSPEEIIRKLRQADAELAAGQPIAAICQKLGVAEATFHRWRNQYGGMKANDARRLKELERENARLKKLVADQALDQAILKEALWGIILSPTHARWAVVPAPTCTAGSFCDMLWECHGRSNMAQHRRTIALVTSAHMSQSRGQVAYPYGIHRLVAALAGHAQRLLICAPTIEGTASEHETTGDPGGNVELCPLPSFRHQWSAFAHAPAILSQYACVCRACQVLIIRGICPFVAILYLLAWWYRCQVCHLCISDNMAIVRAHRRRGVVLDWLACGFVWQDTLARRWGRWLTDGTLACFGTEIARLYPSPRTEVVVSSAVVEEDIVTRLDTCRQGAVQLLFVGVVRPEKGVHTLLEALPLLRTSRSWHLTIAGPFSAYPNYRKELDRLIAERGLDGHVSWRGPIAHGVPLYELMRASDIFVLPSLTEGTPHVISEARAQGLPVIASRVGGIPDMVSNGVDGLLVPPEEPAPLAQAIGRILEDGALRRSLICAGFSTVRNHTVDRLAARLLEFIHS